MNITKRQYNEMFEKLKGLGIWSHDFEIHEVMSIMGIEIHTYSESEIVEGFKEEMKKLNDEL